MAGDWIKMRKDLPTDPATLRIADALQLDAASVIGRLFIFWAWVDSHSADGNLVGVTEHAADAIVGTPGFARALVDVDWLASGSEGIRIPRFERHNGQSAKRRCNAQLRQSRYRDRSVTPALRERNASVTREEKRREEKNTSLLNDASASFARSRQNVTRADGEIEWTREHGFTGIGTDDRAAWAEAYPACDISRQLAAMHQWLLANPERSRKKRWRRFVTNWLTRAQERGGDRPDAHVQDTAARAKAIMDKVASREG